MRHAAKALLVAAGLAILPGTATAQELKVPTETFRLANGLTVIVHEDHSAPVVAVNVWYHVGSGREVEGRSGFAHLFEHMMFQGSANVGDDKHFAFIQEAGGTLVLEPGGVHLMLVDVERLEVGDTVNVTLQWQMAGAMQVEAEVVEPQHVMEDEDHG